MQAIDTVYVDFRNVAGLRRECEEARRDGFTGKMAIHPAQVAIINEVFTPTPAAVAKARAVIAAFAAAPGAGTVGIGGVMYDRPHLARARQLLAPRCGRASRAGQVATAHRQPLPAPTFLRRTPRSDRTSFSRVAEFERHRAALAERHHAVEARAPAGVAGAGAVLLDPDPHRVLVAVDPHLDDALHVAGGLALPPQLAARAAEKPGLAGLDGLRKRLGVHMGDHQHIARPRVGGNAGNEAVGVELRRERRALLDLLGRAADGEWDVPAQFGRRLGVSSPRQRATRAYDRSWYATRRIEYRPSCIGRSATLSFAHALLASRPLRPLQRCSRAQRVGPRAPG